MIAALVALSGCIGDSAPPASDPPDVDPDDVDDRLNATVVPFAVEGQMTLWGAGTPAGWENVGAPSPGPFNDNCIQFETYHDGGLRWVAANVTTADSLAGQEEWRLGFIVMGTEYWFEVQGMLPLDLSLNLSENPPPPPEEGMLLVYVLPHYDTVTAQLGDSVTIEVTGLATDPEALGIKGPGRGISCS